MVVDAYGDITGLVTVNDVVEAVIGRTQGGGGDSTALVVARDDGSLLVDGSLTVDNLRELLGTGVLPLEEIGRDTSELQSLMLNSYAVFSLNKQQENRVNK